MRLIDLDKAVSIYDEDDNSVIFTNIKEAEVKAIPVRWIKKWMAKNAIDDNRKKFYEMLEDWEWEQLNENK